MSRRYDAIVVGGRCAGAATAMLLARGGLDVLVLESAHRGTDTLSTHALMRGAVVQLDRWGLLPAVVDAGTPAIRATEFHYGADVDTITSRPGTTPLRAPRRTVLDPLLTDAATAAGAEVRFGARVTGLVRDDRGAVAGVDHVERGTRTTARAACPDRHRCRRRRSTVAEAVQAPYERVDASSSAVALRLPDRARPRPVPLVLPARCDRRRHPHQQRRGLRVGRRPDRALRRAARRPRGRLPDPPGRGRAGARRRAHRHRRPARPRLPRRPRLRPPRHRSRLGAGRRRRLLQGPPDRPRHHRRPTRRRAACPRTARRNPSATSSPMRDRLSADLAAITDRIASYAWDLAELRDLLPALSRAMHPEVEALRALDLPAALAA